MRARSVPGTGVGTHIVLPHYGAHNGCLFSGAEENPEGHVEEEEEEEKGRLFWSKSWPCAVF